MSLDQSPPKSPPAPPEPVPFPEQEGPRALPASDVGITGTREPVMVPAFVKTADGKPLTEQQAQNLFDFINSRMTQSQQQPAAAAVDESIDAGYAYAPSADEHRELGAIVRLESDKVRERINALSLASRSGMFTFAEFVVEMLVEFQQKYFEEHQRIISLTEAWVMLVGVVNMVLPDDK